MINNKYNENLVLNATIYESKNFIKILNFFNDFINITMNITSEGLEFTSLYASQTKFQHAKINLNAFDGEYQASFLEKVEHDDNQNNNDNKFVSVKYDMGEVNKLIRVIDKNSPLNINVYDSFTVFNIINKGSQILIKHLNDNEEPKNIPNIKFDYNIKLSDNSNIKNIINDLLVYKSSKIYFDIEEYDPNQVTLFDADSDDDKIVNLIIKGDIDTFNISTYYSKINLNSEEFNILIPGEELDKEYIKTNQPSIFNIDLIKSFINKSFYDLSISMTKNNPFIKLETNDMLEEYYILALIAGYDENYD